MTAPAYAPRWLSCVTGQSWRHVAPTVSRGSAFSSPVAEGP